MLIHAVSANKGHFVIIDRKLKNYLVIKLQNLLYTFIKNMKEKEKYFKCIENINDT